LASFALVELCATPEIDGIGPLDYSSLFHDPDVDEYKCTNTANCCDNVTKPPREKFPPASIAKDH
jgi:hypothetical protein